MTWHELCEENRQERRQEREEGSISNHGEKEKLKVRGGKRRGGRKSRKSGKIHDKGRLKRRRGGKGRHWTKGE